MPKEFFVNGDRLTCDDQETFDRLRDQFKENVLVDERGFESQVCFILIFFNEC